MSDATLDVVVKTASAYHSEKGRKCLTLGRSVTVSGLKEEIYKKLYILPDRQSIRVTGGYPITDHDSLSVADIVSTIKAAGGTAEFLVSEPTAKEVKVTSVDREVDLVVGNSKGFDTIPIRKGRPIRLDLKSGKFGLIYHKGTDGGGRITYYIESYKVDKNATVEINSEEDPEKKGELLFKVCQVPNDGGERTRLVGKGKVYKDPEVTRSDSPGVTLEEAERGTGTLSNIGSLVGQCVSIAGDCGAF